MLVVVTGTVFSTLMELAQYYDDGRVTSATDLYANVVGTALGAFAGGLTGKDFRWSLLREIAPNRVPALLLSAWTGYTLFPYVPTVDLHKYWNALKPVIFHPALTGYDLLRQIPVWLAIGSLIEGIVGSKRGWLLFPLFVGVVLLAKVLMVYTTLHGEIAGPGLALGVWGVLDRYTSAQYRNRLALWRLCRCRTARTIPVWRHSPFLWLGATPGLHIQLFRGGCLIISSKIFSLWLFDLAYRQSWTSASFIYYFYSACSFSPPVTQTPICRMVQRRSPIR